MSEIKLVHNGLYWVRRTTRGYGVADDPVIARFSDYGDEDDDDEVRASLRCIEYFATDWFDRPEDVIIVAGPLEIPPPPMGSANA